MGDYRVNLDIFEGPMDLLLYLVRRDEVDIYDISIARVTDQYIQYIEILKKFDIDLASDFLVMAATLMQIKSAMLLPKADPDQLEAEDLTDPRTELVRQLLEYKKFKDAANLLDTAAAEQKQRYTRPSTIIENLKQNHEPEVDIDQVSIWDLVEVFDSIMSATGASFDISHITDDTPIDLYQIEILHRAQNEKTLAFEKIFENSDSRLVMVGLFLGLLELIREKLVSLEQSDSSGKIYLRALTEEPAEQAVQRAIVDIRTEQTEQSPYLENVREELPVPISELPPKNSSSALDSEDNVTESEHIETPKDQSLN